MTKEATLMIFQHTQTLDIYIYNPREYPINFDGKTGRTKPWHQQGKALDPETIEFFNTLVGNQRRFFTIKGRGEYKVLKRCKYKYETDEITESE